MAGNPPFWYTAIINKRRNMDTKTDQMIILAKIAQLKVTQLHLVQEEEKLRNELSRLVSLSDERRRVLDDDTVVAFKE